MIIVKNLNLPESCSKCRFLAYDDYATEHEYECLALMEFMNDDELPKGRRSDCPIFDENVETIQSIVLVGRNGNVAEYTKTIRCEDCKYRDPEDKKCDCGHSIQWNLPRNDEWFCADAERRGEGWKK